MNHNILFSILATATLGLVMAGPVSAKTTNWVSGDATNPAKWNEDNNWSNGIPDAGDTVNIKLLTQPQGYQDPVLSTADGAAGDLTLRNGFTLTITGRTLTLDLAVTHDIDGEIHLTSSASVLKVTGAATLDITGKIVLEASNSVLDLDADVTASGTGGVIKGEHNDAQIQIADGVTFTNNVDIVGQMTIKESGTTGTFLNGSSGLVLANVDGTLLFADELDIDDVSGALWHAKTDPGALLKFASDSPDFCIEGDFVIDNCATIELAAGVVIKTEGGFTQTAGTLTYGSGASLSKDCASPCTGCTSVSAGTNGGC